MDCSDTIVDVGGPPRTRSRKGIAGLSALIGVPVRIVATVRLWRRRARTRRELAEMSDYLLRDIGVDYGTAWRESRKPFWKP